MNKEEMTAPSSAFMRDEKCYEILIRQNTDVALWLGKNV
jgi:hypothetical protein